MPQNEMVVRPRCERNREQTYRPFGGEVGRACADIPEPALGNDIGTRDLAAVDLPAGLIVLVDDERGRRIEIDVEGEPIRRPARLDDGAGGRGLEARLRATAG